MCTGVCTGVTVPLLTGLVRAASDWVSPPPTGSHSICMQAKEALTVASKVVVRVCGVATSFRAKVKLPGGKALDPDGSIEKPKKWDVVSLV